MLKVIVGMNEFKGILANYERQGQDLVLRFVVRRSSRTFIELNLPSIEESLLNFITRLGLDKLKDSTIDLNTGKVTVADKYKSSGNTVEKAKQKAGNTNTIGTGSIVG